jgi:hypothetical protein
MRRLLGSLVLLIALGALAGCGDEEPGTADDPAGPSTTQAAGPPEVVQIVSRSAAGPAGSSTTPTVLDSDQAVADFLARFDSSAFVGEIQDAVDAHDPEPGRVTAAVVLAVGCDVPTGATITEDGAGWRVTPTKVPSPQKNCYVPVTSVAVLDLPEG